MILRKYEAYDCQHLTELFYNTVHSVNAKDYTEEQLNAWTTGHMDLEVWNTSLSKHYSLVAVENDTITGFADMDAAGYLDRLYVHKDCQGRGIASALCDALETIVNTSKFTTHASITARPFFEKRGYKVIAEQEVDRTGVVLKNYCMKKINTLK